MPPKKYQDRGVWVYTGTSNRLKEIREEAKKRGLQPSKYLMAAEESFQRSDPPEQPGRSSSTSVKRIIGLKLR